MSEKEIIEEFVNSEHFTILHNYCTKSYEETITELDKEIQQLKEQLKAANKGLKKVATKRKNGKQSIIK